MTSPPGQSIAHAYPNTSSNALPTTPQILTPHHSTWMHKLVGLGQSWLTEKKKTKLVCQHLGKNRRFNIKLQISGFLRKKKKK